MGRGASERALEVVKPIGVAGPRSRPGCGVVAALAEWRELAVLGTACLLLLVLALPFLLGRTSVSVDLRLQPERVAAGESVAAGVVVVNIASRDWSRRRSRCRSARPSTATASLARAGRRARGVVHHPHRAARRHRVGPAMTRRGDPIGIFSRDVVWTPVREVLVRRTWSRWSRSGAGLLRDLEGVSTDAVSQSDLAFHALREYVPGDDLRHIHWRSSAKVMASTGESALLVRQYLDTRRSHATIVVDDRLDSWSDPRTSRRRCRWRRRSRSGPCSTSSTCPSCAATRLVRLRRPPGARRRLPRRLRDRGLVEVRAAGQHAWRPTPASRSSSAAPTRRSPTCSARRRPSRPRCAASRIVVDPHGNSRVTETGGLPVLHLAAKEDLGGLLRWSVR